MGQIESSLKPHITSLPADIVMNLLNSINKSSKFLDGFKEYSYRLLMYAFVFLFIACRGAGILSVDSSLS